MGNFASCVKKGGTSSEASYDMTRVRGKNVPFIWITGQPNTGKKTLGHLIQDRYEFDYINITDLLRTEATKDSKRAQNVNDALKSNKKVSDVIVIDLLKEALINSSNDKGFLIANFPKNPKQAERFIREIANVNFIFYFYSEVPLLIERAQEKSGVMIDPDNLRREISVATRDLKMCLSKFTLKIESVNTSGRPEETFVKVENALIRRINLRPIKTETDYVQPQQSKIKHVPPPSSLAHEDRGHKEKEEKLIVEPKKEESVSSVKKETKPGDLKKRASSRILSSPAEQKEENKLSKRASSKILSTPPEQKEENKLNKTPEAEKEEFKDAKKDDDIKEDEDEISKQDQTAEDDDSVSLSF